MKSYLHTKPYGGIIMRTIIFIVFFLQSFFAWATVIENIQCFSTTMGKIYDNNEELLNPFVSSTTLNAVRTKTQANGQEIYFTEGTYTNSEGAVTSEYKSERTTTHIPLSANTYKEESTTRVVSRYPDKNDELISHNTEVTYEVQADGSKKVIKNIVDGIEVPLGVEFTVIANDGTEYSSYFQDQPQIYKNNEGSKYVTDSMKSICITKK